MLFDYIINGKLNLDIPIIWNKLGVQDFELILSSVCIVFIYFDHLNFIVTP